MKKAFILSIFILLSVSCAKKIENTTAVTTETPPPAKTNVEVAPISIDEEKVVKQREITVVATGFGTDSQSALTDAKINSILEVTDILISEGAVYVNTPETIPPFAKQNHSKYIISDTTLKKDTPEAGVVKIEIRAKINATRLTKDLFYLNDAKLIIKDSNALYAKVNSDINLANENKKAIQLKFKSLFANLQDILLVEITSFTYDETKLKDGKAPFIVSFNYGVNQKEYTKRALELENLLINSMGAKLQSTTYLSKDKPRPDGTNYYTFPSMGVFDNRMFGIIFPSDDGKDYLKIYKISENYLDFFTNQFLAGNIIGTPFNNELKLSLKDASGKVLFEDFFKIINPRISNRSYDGDDKVVDTRLALLNKGSNPSYSGKFFQDYNGFYIYGAVSGQIESFASVYFNDLQKKREFNEPHPFYRAVLSPYIFSYINSWNNHRKGFEMQYNGIVNINDVKKIKSVNIEYKK